MMFLSPVSLPQRDFLSLERADRNASNAGGVAILCKDELDPHVLNTTMYQSFEHIIISVM